MKLNIDILDNESTLKQLEAVREYIRTNGFRETGKDTGHKVKHSMGINHVSCNKTKSGNYSFKVWLAI